MLGTNLFIRLRGEPRARDFRWSSLLTFLVLLGVLLLPLALGQDAGTDADGAQTPPNAFGLEVDPKQSALEPVAPVAKAQIGLLYYTLWLSIIVIVGVGGTILPFSASAVEPGTTPFPSRVTVTLPSNLGSF
jgi:hypothetical protein